MTIRAVLIALALVLVAFTPAAANDTTAQLGTGGLIFTRSEAVAMEKEDLFISEEEVRVEYLFRNRTDKDVESIVAFPMPELTADPYGNVGVPDFESDNFLGFTVSVDGRSIEPELDQRALAAGIDVTGELKEALVPLMPFTEEARQAIDRLGDDVRADWVTRGILFDESYEEDGKTVATYYPGWSLASTYWWRMTFPAGKPVEVRHSYTPSVGGTVATTFVEDGVAKGERFRDYQSKYCMDAGFVRAVERAAKAGPDGYAPFYESWISYVLTTGGNWASSIGDFTLTIDKGSERSLISFCGDGVEKVGPTTFRMKKTDFYPERDLEILILKRMEP